MHKVVGLIPIQELFYLEFAWPPCDCIGFIFTLSQSKDEHVWINEKL